MHAEVGEPLYYLIRGVKIEIILIRDSQRPIPYTRYSADNQEGVTSFKELTAYLKLHINVSSERLIKLKFSSIYRVDTKIPIDYIPYCSPLHIGWKGGIVKGEKSRK